MAYGRSNVPSRGTWIQEQKTLLNTASKEELDKLTDEFDQHFAESVQTIIDNYNGANVISDVKELAAKPELRAAYKQEFLEPILNDIKNRDCTEPERIHLEAVADQLNETWDAAEKAFVVQEAFNTSNYLPLSTLDFPALVKQYIRFVGKDIIPIETASNTSIEQRIFTKYLVDNNTGEEYETPAIYFMKDEDGKPLWKKLFDAGKGYKINDKEPILFADIKDAKNKKFNMYDHLLGDDGKPFKLEPTIRTRLSYDFNIEYVDYKGKKLRLPGAGIQIDFQTGGTFLNGIITEDMKLSVVDPDTNKPTGETVSLSDRIMGAVDVIKGTMTAGSCGEITGVYVNGYISNETNLRTIGFREYPEIRKFTIGDGCRFQLPFTIEDYTDSNNMLNFNLYSRMVQEIVGADELFEDEYILNTLDEDFEKYDGDQNTNIWALDSYVHTEYVDLDPTSISPTFAGDPFEYRTNAIHNALNSLIYELCDRGKLDNLAFVIYGNPKVIRLLNKFTTWTTQKGTSVGGVQMNHSFGVITDTDVPIRVVSSNRIDAYTLIPAYQDGAAASDLSREYMFKVVAYPMDKFHITHKHLRYARHITNSPENAGYQDVHNPGGQAALITISSRYKTVHVQGIQGRIVCLNSKLVPDSLAGIVEGTSQGTGGGTTVTTDPNPGGGGTGGDDPVVGG